MPFTDMRVLCVFLFIMNFFVSTQDIAVDALAVSLLQARELGSGNTAQVVGYKLGSIFGGGVLLWLMEIGGWFSLFGIMALLYMEAFMFVFISPSFEECKVKVDHDLTQRVKEWQMRNMAYEEQETDKENISDSNNCDEDALEPETVEDPAPVSHFSLLVKSARDLMNVPGTKWMLVFVLIYKLGE
jgi:MFS family permease